MNSSSKKGTGLSKQKESVSYPKIMEWIKKSYPKAWIYRTTDRFRAGIPDFLFCADGRLVAIEVKREGKKARLLQEYELNKIIAAGGVAFIAYGHSFVNTHSLKELVENDTTESIICIGRSPGNQN